MSALPNYAFVWVSFQHSPATYFPSPNGQVFGEEVLYMSLTPALLPGGPHCEDFPPTYGVRYTDVNANRFPIYIYPHVTSGSNACGRL